MPIWEAALWAGMGPLMLEAVQFISVVRRTNRLPSERQGLLLSAFLVSILVRCALGTGIGILVASTASFSPFVLMLTGMGVPVIFTQLARSVPELDHDPKLLGGNHAREASSETSSPADVTPPAFSESVKQSFRGKRALLVAAGLTIASAHPLAINPFATQGTQVVSMVQEERPSIVPGQRVALSRQASRKPDKRTGEPRGGHDSTTQSRPALRAPCAAIAMASGDSHLFHSMMFNFTDGLGSVFDPLAETPPPPTPAVPSFVDSFLSEAHELACAHGFQDDSGES
ncbi:hypothetical protein [Streptomyces sp. NPDC059991]|uniref:hypothetical protein n=1 Tax=unclassified Streptomyces TaxID=2593676 RepID=UPI00369395CB